MVQRIGADAEGSGVIPPTRVPAADLRDPQYRNLNVAPTSPLEAFEPEGGPELVDPPAPVIAPPGFTAEQIEKARREERDKVNKRLQAERERAQAYEAELAELRQFREQAQAAEEAKARSEAKKTRKAQEADMSAKEILAAREEEWERQREADRAELQMQLEQMRRDREQEQAQLKLEREVLQLQNYATSQVSAAVNDKLIAPQFVRFINGTTKEAIDQQIEDAIAATAEILEQVSGQQAAAQQRSGVSTASGPSSMGTNTEVTEQPLDYTKLSLKDYIEKVRPRLQIDRQDNGIFG